MDVCDAVMSRRDLEIRQKILKDSRVGAFAVICICILMLAQVGSSFSLFEIEDKYIELAINDIKNILGDNHINEIGKNITIIDKIITIAINYSEKDSN